MVAFYGRLIGKNRVCRIDISKKIYQKSVSYYAVVLVEIRLSTVCGLRMQLIASTLDNFWITIVIDLRISVLEVAG